MHIHENEYLLVKMIKLGVSGSSNDEITHYMRRTYTPKSVQPGVTHTHAVPYLERVKV